MSKTRIFTLEDAREEKRAMDAMLFAKHDMRAQRDAEQQALYDLACRLNVGALKRKGRWVFYTFEGGYREAADPRELVTH